MAIDDLLAKLDGLRADAFASTAGGTGLEKPSLTVFAKFDEGKREERVSFARSGTDVYAAVPGQPGAARVAAASFDDMIKALDVASK
jgi:hypothetical protein